MVGEAEVVQEAEAEEVPVVELEAVVEAEEEEEAVELGEPVVVSEADTLPVAHAEGVGVAEADGRAVALAVAELEVETPEVAEREGEPEFEGLMVGLPVSLGLAFSVACGVEVVGGEALL